MNNDYNQNDKSIIIELLFNIYRKSHSKIRFSIKSIFNHNDNN